MLNQCLDPTWIGRGEDPQAESRILFHDSSKGYSDPNTLIHRDNLLVLKALEQGYAGRVKYICIAPVCSSETS